MNRRVTHEQEEVLVTYASHGSLLTVNEARAWARGETIPRPERARKLCELLGIEAVWL